MTKPDPNVPDPGTPDRDTPKPETPKPGIPAGPTRAPEGDASGARTSGADAQSADSQSNDSQSKDSQSNDARSAEEQTRAAQAADDEAVWLDLVARLEGVSDSGPDDGFAVEERAGGDGTAGGGTAGGGAAGAPPAKAFRDFDPLGLSGAAPIELSAAERLGSAPAEPAAAGGHDAPDPAAGPRDYESDDDDGAFVPEEPPSLVGADPMTMLAWIGAVGGPIALVLSAMFWRSAPMVAIVGMVAVFAASVVFLIMKLPGEKDEHDDGARV